EDGEHARPAGDVVEVGEQPALAFPVALALVRARAAARGRAGLRGHEDRFAGKPALLLPAHAPARCAVVADEAGAAGGAVLVARGRRPDEAVAQAGPVLPHAGKLDREIVELPLANPARFEVDVVPVQEGRVEACGAVPPELRIPRDLEPDRSALVPGIHRVEEITRLDR